MLGFKLLSVFVVENGELISAGSRSVRPPNASLRVEGRGITTKAAREKHTIFVSDIRNDPDFVKGSIASLSEMAVPVVVAGEIAAMINVEDTRPGAFSEMDRVLLETLASHVATAMYRLKHQEEDTKAQVERTRELLENANRVTAMVRHDLRGPLQTIRSASFLMRSDPSKAEMLTQTIDQSVDYATKILDDLRTNTTPVKLQQSLVNLKDIVEDRVKAVSLSEGVKLRTSFETEFLAATVDPDRIRRMMDNLLKNAVEAMPGGGTLAVRVKRVGSSAVIEVSDTGTGIPPDMMANLFKPFYSNKKGGHGARPRLQRAGHRGSRGEDRREDKRGQGYHVPDNPPTRTP